MSNLEKFLYLSQKLSVARCAVVTVTSETPCSHVSCLSLQASVTDWDSQHSSTESFLSCLQVTLTGNSV